MGTIGLILGDEYNPFPWRIIRPEIIFNNIIEDPPHGDEMPELD
jgi:hypothetical protein